MRTTLPKSNMVDTGRILKILLCVLVSFELNSGFLDLEELKSVHYGISIINDPVVMGQEPPGAILLRSKFGQQYQCSYPDRQSEDEKAKQEQQEAIDTGIPELLKPMGQEACLIYPKDWWTYEFCYGKFVKQYHMENGKIVDNLIYLGYYESEFDWNNITEQDKRRKYHSQSYTNGTICDLTSNQRRVEVRFECEEGSGDYVHEISEAETCVYTLKVHTPRVCKHPYLQKPAPSVPIPITCNPVVTPEQYQDHMDAIQEQERIIQERTRLKERRLLENPGEEKRDGVKRYKITERDPPSPNIEINSEMGEGNTNSATDSDQQTAGDLREVQEEPTVERLLRNSFGLKDNEELGDKNSHPLAKDKNLKIKVFKDHSELRDYLRKMVTEGKSKEDTETGEAAGEGEDDEESVVVEEKKEDETEEAEDDEDTLIYENSEKDGVPEDMEDEEMEEFIKELDGVLDTEEKKVHMAQYKDTIKSAMQSRFSDILEEVKTELGDEVDVGANKGVAFKAMAQTLNKLVKKMALMKLLRKTEKEKESMEHQLQLAEQRMKERRRQAGSDNVEDSDTDIPEEHARRDDVEADEYSETDERHSTYTEDDSLSGTDATHKKTLKTIENTILENSQSTDDKSSSDNIPTDSIHEDNTLQTDDAKIGDDAEDAAAPDQEEMHSMENRVRVRVTRIKHAPPADAGAGAGGGGGGPGLEGGDPDKKSLDLPEEQRKQLESTVKSELEKAGLETQGQKIEVKIITAGYFDTNKEGVHVLSEEESSAFNNMIVSILEGNNQAAQEMRRQREMEESYSYVWGQNTKRVKAAPASTQTPPPAPSEAPPHTAPTQAPPSPNQDPDTPSTAPEAPTEPQQPPPE